jgi:hypothetical protein
MVEGVRVGSLDCWDRGFEFRWEHEGSSLVFVVCCLGSVLCNVLFTHSEESYRWCVYNCVK